MRTGREGGRGDDIIAFKSKRFDLPVFFFFAESLSLNRVECALNQAQAIHSRRKNVQSEAAKK